MANYFRFLKSANVSSTAATGGRATNFDYPNASLHNIFPSTPAAETATVPVVLNRKVHVKFETATDNSILSTVLVFLQDVARGYKIVNNVLTEQASTSKAVLIAGTHRNALSDLTGSERKYSTGILNANVTAGGSVLTVAYPNGLESDLPVQTGDTLVLCGAVMTADVERAVVASVSWAANIATITLETPLFSNYIANETQVASAIKVTDLQPLLDNIVVTSATGGFDLVLPLGMTSLLSARATIEQTWTLTFLTATTFSIIGDTKGLLGNGDINTNTAPNNPDYTLPYFYIPIGSFTGTFIAGDTVVCQTHPFIIPAFIKKTLAVGTAEVDYETTKLAVWAA